MHYDLELMPPVEQGLNTNKFYICIDISQTDTISQAKVVVVMENLTRKRSL